MENLQPGQVILPNGPQPSGDGSPQPVRPAEVTEPTPTPSPLPEPSTPPATQMTAAPAVPKPEPNFYTGTAAPELSAQQQWVEPAPSFATPDTAEDDLNWTASEFMSHDKSLQWFAFLAVAAVAITIVAYLISKDKITAGIILFAAASFGVFATRKPRDQQYALSHSGLQLGSRFYSLHEFKSFSIVAEGTVTSMVLMPLKRFMPPLTLYVPPEMETQVADILAMNLPLEVHKADAVDSLLRRIHF